MFQDESCRARIVLFSFLFSLALLFPAVVFADARVSESYGKLPLHFEANQGQAHEDVRYLSRGPGYSLYLTQREAVLALTHPGADSKSAALRMSLVGASRNPLVTGLEELAGKANYFVGNDSSKWRANVPLYGKVRYAGVYPGVDLVYYGNQRQLEYDFVVAPGADPKKIVLSFKGADKLEIDAQGDLVLHTAGGPIRQHKPVIYQEVDGARQEVAGGYVLKGRNRVGFKLAAYDPNLQLVIDPVLSYSTFLGAFSTDQPAAIAVDAAGNAHVTGNTRNANLATPGAVQPTHSGGGFDAFVAKFNPTGSALIYFTYLGGSSSEGGAGIAVDADGNAYVVGATGSLDFPTTPGAFQPAWPPQGSSSCGGFQKAFIAKLNAAGSALVYSTLLGIGGSTDTGHAIAVDAGGHAYVAGHTCATDFPTTPGAAQPSFGGGGDVFVTKLNPAGSGLVYSTYLGGADLEQVGGIALDAAHQAHVTGFTRSTNFPTTTGAFQAVLQGNSDAFVTKLDKSGSGFVYSTYLGGSGGDAAAAIAVDFAGNAYVNGGTGSTDFPITPGAFQTSFSSSFGSTFVAKLDHSGSALVYSTYLGGNSQDFPSGIAVDTKGNAYVTGLTFSTDFPTTPGAFQTVRAESFDAFVTKLNDSGSALLYSTFLGGSGGFVGGGVDNARAIAVDASGNAYVTGFTNSPSFPTTPGAFQPAFTGGNFNSNNEGFVTKLALGAVLLVIDKDGIDDGKAPTFFSEAQVNNDVAEIGVRAQLRFFRDHTGQTIVLSSGEIGQEGWLALRTIPASWAQAGGAAGFVGNPGANPGDPAPHGTGPGLGAPDASGDRQSLLKAVPNVTPLRETALANLVGREVCAVVYDSQIGVNVDQGAGDLRGKNLGTVAFQVVALTPPTNASPSALPNVEVRIRDAKTVCRGPFALLTNAEITAAAPAQ